VQLRDDETLRVMERTSLDPGPVTDVIDLDTYSKKANTTYWDIRFEIIKIYAEMFKNEGNNNHHFVKWTENPSLIKDMEHKEYYRKVK